MTGIGLDVLAIGVGTSFVAGLAAIWFLVSYLQRRTLLVFVVYRIALGLLSSGSPAAEARRPGRFSPRASVATRRGPPAR